MSLPFDPRFEVAFDVDPGSVPATGDWTDLSDRLRRVSTVFGQSGTIAGLSNVDLDNEDRHLDPTNDASPYNLVPMRHARLSVDIGGTTRQLWRGFVDQWPPVWPGYNRAHVAAALVDATAWFALQDVDLDLPEQRTDERIEALLDAANWPAAARDIQTGIITVEPHEQVSANVFRTLTDTADSEDGVLYIDADGNVVFRNRHHRFDMDPDAVAATAGDGLAVVEVAPEYGADDLTNVARVELADGRVYEFVDTSSRDAYGPRVRAIRDLTVRPVEAEALGQWEVYRYAQPNLSLAQITFRHPDVDELDAIVQRRIGDLIEFTHQPPGGGDPMTMVGHIERIHHTIDDGPWETAWDLSPYFGQGPWLTLDDDVLGLLDDDNMLAP